MRVVRVTLGCVQAVVGHDRLLFLMLLCPDSWVPMSPAMTAMVWVLTVLWHVRYRSGVGMWWAMALCATQRRQRRTSQLPWMHHVARH